MPCTAILMASQPADDLEEHANHAQVGQDSASRVIAWPGAARQKNSRHPFWLPGVTTLLLYLLSSPDQAYSGSKHIAQAKGANSQQAPSSPLSGPWEPLEIWAQRACSSLLSCPLTAELFHTIDSSPF